MVVLIIVIQIASLVFYFKFLDEGGDYEESSNGKYTFEGCLWYFLVGLHFIFILRFIYIQINFSYVWYDQIMEFISIGISLLIVIPTFIYILLKRNRKKNKKN
ncbi:hypothetical protein HNQ03_003200 [Chryseobacterium sp. 16F]|uniref:Uncharacterized protein n=1 Tax=Frigoriflavimonas asaccharolytica TaxID=2735899 RepID=A0A8J8GBC3_9FLAO|nr:hypothetical protein [Frigoriflavimonas asaccharolytica]